MIPDYQTCMLPFLCTLRSGAVRSLRDIEQELASAFALTSEEQAQLLPSGQQGVFRNRVGWARTYLKQAGLLQSPKRGIFLITDRGLSLLSKAPEKIDVKLLEQWPEFVAFQNRSKSSSNAARLPLSTDAPDALATPEELLEVTYQSLRDQLAQELLSRILACSPAFFENLVVELLVKMGYGGSRQDAGQRIGQTGDGGIDGIIKEDRLGLDTIFIQAKRWQGSVGRPDIQKFVGALQGQRARKGVFITTSGYTADALAYVTHIDTKVVLIDGQLLAQLMMDFGVGVSADKSYVIHRIDSDYFEEL